MQSKLNAFDDAAAEVIVTDIETMGWFGLRESVIFQENNKAEQKILGGFPLLAFAGWRV